MSNIEKKQKGGAAAPFVYYQPVVVNDQSARIVAQRQYAQQLKAAQQKATKSSDELGDKDLMNMLKNVNGLPNDMQKVFTQLNIFYKYKGLGAYDIDPSALATQYLQAMYQMKVAAFNKEQYNKAYEKLIDSDALNETAITDRGGLMAMGKDGQMHEISIQKYREQPQDYQLLSNSQLLQIRAQSPTSAFDNSAFNITNNGIGLSKVNKLIHEAMAQIGTLETSQNVVTQRKGKEMASGLQAIQDATYKGELHPEAGVDGLYDIKTLTKTQAEQAKRAIKYIYNILPDNAKTLLQLKSNDKNPQNYVLSVISDIVTGTLNETSSIERKLILDDEGNKPGGKSGKKTSDDSADDSDMHIDLLQNIIQGVGGSDSFLMLRDKDGRTYEVAGKSYPDLSVNANNPIPKETSLQSLLTTYHLSGVLDNTSKYAITFGDQILQNYDYKNIAYLNDSNAVRALIPVKMNDKGDINDRRFVPDFEFMSKHKELMKLIRDKGSINSPEVREYMINNKIVNPVSGEPDTSMFKEYLIVDGLGTSQEIRSDTYVSQITGDSKDRYVQMFKNSVFVNGGNEGSDYKYDFADHWFGIASDKLYQGMIFLPLTVNVVQGKTSAGTTLKQEHADMLERDAQQAQKRDNMHETSSDLLGL